MSTTRAKYDAAQIETARQAAWAERDAFATPEPTPGARSIYIKPSSPFTSGKLHMGHVRDYSIGDAYARFRRARGDDVLFGFGFDAFGLPAEMAAIERKIPPADWVESCGERMLEQMRRLGFSFDYERVFYSSDEAQYRWSQWLFVTLLEAGLIYRDDTTVDWCDHCRTTLAALQVEDGTLLALPQRGAADPPPDLVPPHHALPGGERRPPAGAGARLGRDLALHPALHPRPQRWGGGGPRRGRRRFVDGLHPAPRIARRRQASSCSRRATPRSRHGQVTRPSPTQLDELRSGGWERSARDAKSVPLVDTGAAVRAPWNGAELPVIVSPLVDARYGPTAALGIPAVDEADAAIAARVPRLDGGDERATAATTAEPQARATVRYRAADFSISRQRFWGTPIPIINCESCGPVPVPEQDLPVVLPRDIEPTGEGNPLAERAEFVDVACPRCGEPAKRETDTLDCHFDALWLWVPSAVPPEARAEEMFTHPDLQRWLPSERLVAGADSGGFVFDQRVVTKALRDIGPFAFLEHGEPFSGCLFHEMVIADGRKMSKHLGNVVDPDALVEQYGADTVRLAVLYAAGPAKTLNWNDGALRFASRFLHNVWIYSQARFAGLEAALEDAEAAGRHRVHARAPLQVVRQRPRPHHRGPRGAADAQGGAQRDPALRAHPGLREARDPAPRRPAMPRRRRGPGGGAEAAGADPGAVRPARGRGAVAGRWSGGRRGSAGRLAGASCPGRGPERGRRREADFPGYLKLSRKT